MAISFPSSPTTNQTYTAGSKTWIWNGYAWDLVLANTSPIYDFAGSAYNKANSAVQTGFTTISANSVSISPSSNTDILTISAGNNITISACTASKTITFSSSASGGSTSSDISYQEFTASNNQTTFTVTGGYVVGSISVYVNGVLLSGSDYTATNGTSVVLSSAAKINDIVTVSKWSSSTYSATNVSSQILTFDDASITSNTVSTTTSTANQILDITNTSIYRSIKYLVQVTSGSSYQSSELLLIHDGTNAYVSEYGLVYTGSTLMSYDADVSGGYARLLMTPTNNINTINLYKTSIII